MDRKKERKSMTKEPQTEGPETRRSISRKGKIARLPRDVRDELNRRLRDGESGKSLVGWLNELPETKAALLREYGGRPISGQNLSEWKQGGFRDWVAKTEADELMADTMAEEQESKEKGGSCPSASRRKGFRGRRTKWNL
jgi:hypothetical protein